MKKDVIFYSYMPYERKNIYKVLKTNACVCVCVRLREYKYAQTACFRCSSLIDRMRKRAAFATCA